MFYRTDLSMLLVVYYVIVYTVYGVISDENMPLYQCFLLRLRRIVTNMFCFALLYVPSHHIYDRQSMLILPNPSKYNYECIDMSIW